MGLERLLGERDAELATAKERLAAEAAASCLLRERIVALDEVVKAQKATIAESQAHAQAQAAIVHPLPALCPGVD